MRQYYTGPLADSLITPQSAVSPGTSLTALMATNQVNKFLPLPYGQNAPSPGSIFRMVVAGLFTTPASNGNTTIAIYHGTTTGGTLIATSVGITPTSSMTAGYWRIEGELVYRTISEISTTSTCWFAGKFFCCGPSGGTLAPIWGLLESNAAVSVDTTGLAANLFGALTPAVTPTVTGSTWTPEIAFIEQVN